MPQAMPSDSPDSFCTAVQVDVRVGPASETLDRLAAEGKRFDLAFLDADKTGYLGYYKKVGPYIRLSFARVSYQADVVSSADSGVLRFLKCRASCAQLLIQNTLFQ